MKKTTILGLSALCMGAMVFAQQGRVGVNTETPQATLDIAKLSNPDEGQVEGVLFPRLTKAQRDAMQNVPNGTMIFNTTKNCIDWYDGSFWQCLDGTQQDTKPFVSPKTITLHSAKKFISSIYDNNYQPYTAPTTPATWDRDVAPNGDVTNETPVIDFQGVLTTAGLRIKIPVTVTANGTLPAYADNYVVPAEHTEDGVSRVVNLSWPEQAYTAETRFIVATVKSVGGDLKVKKLDLNSGVGYDYQGNLLAQFDLVDRATVQLRAISGIPDRCAGIPTSTCVNYRSGASDEKEHNFVYVPITDSKGRIWLNNNLGAAYTDVDNPTYFNPNHQAGAYDRRGNLTQNPDSYDLDRDWRAYGSLFQWGRKPDGHELIKWSSHTQASPKYQGAGSLANSPVEGAGTNKFIPANDSHGTWVIKENALYSFFGRWYNDSERSNNPCPVGFVLPSYEQFENYSDIILPRLTKDRLSNGQIPNQWNSYTGYWTRNICGYPTTYYYDSDGEIHYVCRDTATGGVTSVHVRATKGPSAIAAGAPVRCIKINSN